jgi:hypothetical protein
MTGHDNGVITIALSEAGDIERGAGCRWENPTGPFSATSDMKWATIIGTCWCAIEGSWMLFGKFLATIRWITARLYAATTRKGRPQPGRRATSPPMRRLTPGGFCRDPCAHYLHTVDTLEMAGNFGMQIAPAADRIGGLRARVELGPLCDRGLRRRDPGVVSIRTRDEKPEPHHRHPGTGPVIGKLRLFMSWFNASGRCYRRLRRRGGGQSPRCSSLETKPVLIAL